MKITNKHVAIVAGVLGLAVFGQWCDKQNEEAAAAAYQALPAEEKVAIDIQKRMDKFYIPALRNDKSDESCGVKCLVTGEDVKKQGIKVFTENGKLAYEWNDKVVINALLEKEYPKNGMGARTCEELTSAYSGMLTLMRVRGGGDGAINYLKATGEQKGERWDDYKQRVYGGMVNFATMHNAIGIKGIDKFLHGEDTRFIAAPSALRNENKLAREFENMCYAKGNVGMMQTIYLISEYHE